MQISQIISIFWRRRWVIIVTLAVCLLVTLAITKLMPAVYRTIAVVRVLTPGTGINDSGTYISTQYADRVTATYLEVLASTPVLNQLAERVGLSNYEELPDIETEVMAGTELMEIRVYDENPRIANEFGQMLVENPYWLFGDRRPAIESLRQKLAESEAKLTDLRQQYEDLFESANPNRNTADTLRAATTLEEQNYAELTRQYQQANLLQEVQSSAVTLVQPAEPPERPYRPVVALNIAIGMAAGLVGGLGLALLFENLDNAIYTTAQVESIVGERIIGQIPKGRGQRGALLRVNDASVLEGYRWLRANVLAESAGYHTLLVASAEQREGKSSVVGNLGVVIAQTDRSVLLIDGNLRQPMLHTMFDASNDVGFSEVLVGTVPLGEAIQPIGDSNLYLLAGGSAADQATDLLNSDKLRSVLRQVGREFDMVLIDSPAATSFADAVAIAPLVDAVIVVVERARTREPELRNLMGSLEQVDATMAGVVVNRAGRRNRAASAPTRRSQQQRPVQEIAPQPVAEAPAPEAEPGTNGKDQYEPMPAATDDL